MGNQILYSTLSREELEDRLDNLFNQRGYANLEMKKSQGSIYLTKKPYIDPLTRIKYHAALNPLQIRIELIPKKDGTQISVNTQTLLWSKFIGILVGGLIWITLFAFWIAGQMNSIYPLVLASIVTTIFVFFVKKNIISERKVLLQIENEIRLT